MRGLARLHSLAKREEFHMRKALADWRTMGAMLVAASCLLAARPAAAGTTCAASPQPGVEQCVTGLAPALLREIQQPQQASNWCWAAVVSMVLQRYGLSVPQRQVVQARLGEPANTKVSVDGLTELLNREWRDAAGQSAQASAAPLPTWWRQRGLAAPDVLEDLRADRPLVLVAQEHAMLLVQVVYERSADHAVRLVRAMVLDPSTEGGLRMLRGSEQQLDFLARVQVRAAAQRIAAAGE